MVANNLWTMPAVRGTTHGDAWANIITGINDINYDKQMSHNVITPIENSSIELDSLYAGDDLYAKIVETPAKEMLRQGFKINTETDGLEKWIFNKFDELSVIPWIIKAMSWARAYGGAVIVLGVDDANENMIEPLNMATIKNVRWIDALDRFDVSVNKRYSNHNESKYGQPELYQVAGIGSSDNIGVQTKLIHETRIIRFDGVISSKRRKRDNNGWGDSVYVRLKQSLRRNDLAWSGAAHLMTDFSQAVYGITGLAKMLAEDRDDEILARIRVIDRARSSAHMIPIDSENETFERKTTPLGGLPEVLQLFIKRVSGASGIPVAILMGDNPAGLNATGDSTIRFFYDSLAAEQKTILLPVLNKLIQICLLSEDSPFKTEPDEWLVKFNPLWQMTELEMADLRLKTSQADSIDIQNGVLDPDEVTTSRYGGESYSLETNLNMEARNAFASAIIRNTSETTPEEIEETYATGSGTAAAESD